MKTTIKINQETLLKSILSDTFSILALAFLFWFNYHFIGGSYIVNFLILLGIILYLSKVFEYKKYMIDHKHCSIYYRVSPKKIEEIKKILEEK